MIRAQGFDAGKHRFLMEKGRGRDQGRGDEGREEDVGGGNDGTDDSLAS
jgi:hypothetical protein